jgi:hypothetical protein
LTLGATFSIVSPIGSSPREVQCPPRTRIGILYEAALRDGDFVVSVAAGTDERKDVAARILLDHGAHFVNFLGRYTMAMIAR